MKRPFPMFVRLAIAFGAVLALTLATVVALTLFFANNVLETSIDDTLFGTADTLTTRLAQGANAQEEVDSLATAGEFLEVLDATGEPTARSFNARTGEPETMFGGGHLDEDVYRTVELRRSEWRILRHPMTGGDGAVQGYVVIGGLVPRVDSRLTSLAAVLGLTAVVGAAGGTGLSVFLLRREVRPLRELAASARQAAAGGGDRALTGGEGGSSEVRDLRASLALFVDAQRQLVARERSFFADSSHVLRTPLTVLQGDIEQFEQGTYGAERAEVIAQAKAAIGQMSRTIGGLLLLSRDGGGRPADWEVCDLGELLAPLCDEARTAYPHVTVLAPEATPELPVAGDRNQLRALFLGLLENACQYTPAGGHVSVVLEAAGEDAVVEVRDDGIGITPEEASQATKRFFRGQHARALFPQGSGLGLARRIAEDHNGTLAIAPRDGGGTVARVTLPLVG